MPISKDNIYYLAGRQAFAAGKSLADKPAQYLTLEWEWGWIDALADSVRGLKSKPK